MTDLNLSVLTDAGPKAFASASGSDIQIGREVDAPGINVPASAVSSIHGVFSYREGFWLYRDLDSTNGSWINGVKLEPESINLVRNGDILKVADVNLQIHQNPNEIKRSEEPALLVFKSQRILGVAKAVPGMSLKFGGLDADFPVSGGGPINTAILEFDGNDFIIKPKSNDIDVTINGRIISQASKLIDLDRVLLSDYCMIVSDAYAMYRQKVSIPAAAAIEQTMEVAVLATSKIELPATLLAPPEKKISNPQFGNYIENSTMIEDSGLHILPNDSGRVKTAAVSANPLLGIKDLAPSTAEEDKIMLYFGGFLALAFFALILWWLFF